MESTRSWCLKKRKRTTYGGEILITKSDLEEKVN